MGGFVIGVGVKVIRGQIATSGFALLAMTGLRNCHNGRPPRNDKNGVTARSQ